MSVVTLPGQSTDHDIVYAGTGNRSSGDITNAIGIFKSENGGLSWHQLSTSIIAAEAAAGQKPATSSLLGFSTLRLLAPKSVVETVNDGNIILAATTTGLLQSFTGGEDTGSKTTKVPGWTEVSGFRGLPTGPVSDLVEILNNDGTRTQTFMVSVLGHGIYRSNDLIVWEQVNPTGQAFGTAPNIKLAVHGKGSSARVFAAMVEPATISRLDASTMTFTSQSTLKTTVFQTDNLGTGWTSLGSPSTNEDVDGNGTAESTFFLHGSTTQASLHFSLAAHPTLNDVVFIGGDTQQLPEYLGGRCAGRARAAD